MTLSHLEAMKILRKAGAVPTGQGWLITAEIEKFIQRLVEAMNANT